LVMKPMSPCAMKKSGSALSNTITRTSLSWRTPGDKGTQ
jgi:hypothetical protein